MGWLVQSSLAHDPEARPTCVEMLEHGLWGSSEEEEDAQKSLASIWPPGGVPSSAPLRTEDVPTGALLDEDIPVFAPEAQPQFDDVD